MLYHFPAKSSLLIGLAERLRDYTDANVATARREGIVTTFLRTSSPREQEARHYWAMLVAMGADRVAAPAEAEEILHDVFARWSDLLREEVDDPVLAETIRLVGDGLYLTTVAGLPRPSASVVHLVVEHLERLAATRPSTDPMANPSLR